MTERNQILQTTEQFYIDLCTSTVYNRNNSHKNVHREKCIINVNSKELLSIEMEEIELILKQMNTIELKERTTS